MASGETGVVIPFVTRTLPREPRDAVALPEPPLTVLVIEDAPEDRMVIRFALEAGGYVLLEAADGQSGLKQVSRHQPDCILLDYQLPDFSGLELLEKLRRPNGRLPCAVMLLTGHRDAALVAAAIKAGALDYIAKDRLDPDDLCRAVGGAVRYFRAAEDHRRIEQRNAQLSAIVNACSDAIISVDTDAVTIRSWNPAATRLFGYTEGEAIGQTTTALIIPDHLYKEQTAIHEAVRTGQQAVIAQTVRRHKSGELVPVEINASPMVDGQGHVSGFCAIFRDISERRRAEARIAAIHRALSADLTGGEADAPLPETRAPAVSGQPPATRLRLIQEAELFDIPPEWAFDQITRLASSVLQAPISLLTVTDARRQFIVSAHGLLGQMQNGRERPIETSYCRYVIESGAPVVINDASCNPLVAGICAWQEGFVAYLGIPVVDHHGEVIASLSVADSRPRAWTRQDQLLLDGIARLLTRELENRAMLRERARNESALRESEERFRTIVTTAQEGIWAIDDQCRTIFANPRLAELLKTTPDAMVGLPVSAFCFPDDVADAQERIAASIAGHTEEFEFRFRRRDGSALDVLAATAPLRKPDGSVIGALGGFLDLSERKRAEERQLVLMHELAHRGKNLLAVIQSIARRTLASGRTLEDARTAFIGRLQALANTYSSLTDEAFEGAPLDEILTSELGSFSGRAQISGPRVMLVAKVAQTFALIAHELATNAAKYGALSVPTGQVAATWHIRQESGDPRFVFDWRETGGPPATSPARRGFGSTLITTVAGSELKCTPEVVYAEDGFRYRLDAPLSVVGAAIDESPVRQKLQSETLRAFYDAWVGLKAFDGGLPTLKRFTRDRFAASGGLTVAEVDPDGTIRFLEVGRALTERLGRLVRDDDLADDDPDSMKAAYQRCARGRAPCYEHLRFDFGDGNVVTFERLLIPFSRGGKRVTHIAGLVVNTGDTGR